MSAAPKRAPRRSLESEYEYEYEYESEYEFYVTALRIETCCSLFVWMGTNFML